MIHCTLAMIIFQANLAIQEARLTSASTELANAQAQLDEKQAELDEVQAMYDAAMSEKQVISKLLLDRIVSKQKLHTDSILLSFEFYHRHLY